MEIKENNSLKEQSKQVLSVKINTQLYQQLKTQIGKGKISAFVEKTLTKQLATEKKNLGRAYQECYTNNPHLLKEAKLWERVQNEDWVNWERKRSKKRPK